MELKETKTAEEKLEKDFNAYVGKKFEKLILEEALKKIDFVHLQKTGKWWGYYRDPVTKKRIELEIDIVGLNESTKEIVFAECKWSDNVNAMDLLQKLKEKAKYVEWPNAKKNRKEYYILFAKSFKKKTMYENVYYFEQKDIEKLLNQQTRKKL